MAGPRLRPPEAGASAKDGAVVGAGPPRPRAKASNMVAGKVIMRVPFSKSLLVDSILEMTGDNVKDRSRVRQEWLGLGSGN
jgi:hypothetical protein